MEDTASDWYVLGAHARRAIGYLGFSLIERGYLNQDFELPRLLDLWGEALTATMDGNERSPIAEQEGWSDKRVERLREAMREADDLLAGMWSYSPASREAMAHTWPVKASDVLRKALEPEK
jgi:hypothetical protein